MRSSSSKSTSSASTCADTITTDAPSVAAIWRTLSTIALPSAKSLSATLAP